MKILLSFLTLFTALLFIPFYAHAANPAPLPISPITGVITNSTKLEWLVPTYSLKATSPYRVQVSNLIDFSVLSKDTTTSNTFYSPQLAEGIWYWRVLAKDSNNIESDWSQPAQFMYSSVIPSASPTPIPSVIPSPSVSSSPSPEIQTSPTPIPQVTPTPTPNITPTPIPTVSPSPSPTATPSPSFTLNQLPSQINSNQSFSALITLILPIQLNTVFYLKGAFYAEGSSNYFGQTKYNGNWLKNSGSYSTQFKIQTDAQGKWQGYIEFTPDTQDSGFDSSGEYNFKIGRYTATGSGPTWSDSQSIYINEVITPSPSPSPSVSPLPLPIPSISSLELTSQFISLDTLEATEESTLEASESAFIEDPDIATIAGVATTSGTIVKGTTTESFLNPYTNWFYITSGILFMAGLISTLVVKYKPHNIIRQWLLFHNQPKTLKNSPPLWQSDLPPQVEPWR